MTAQLNNKQVISIERIQKANVSTKAIDGRLVTKRIDMLDGKALIQYSNAGTVEWFEKHVSFIVEIGIRGGVRLFKGQDLSPIEQKLLGL